MNNIRGNQIIQGASRNKILYSLLICPMGDPRRVNCTLLYTVMVLFNWVHFSSVQQCAGLRKRSQLKDQHKYINTQRNNMYGTNIYTKQTYNNNETRTQVVSANNNNNFNKNAYELRNTNYKHQAQFTLTPFSFQTMFSKCYRTSELLLSSKVHTTKKHHDISYFLGCKQINYSFQFRTVW